MRPSLALNKPTLVSIAIHIAKRRWDFMVGFCKRRRSKFLQQAKPLLKVCVWTTGEQLLAGQSEALHGERQPGMLMEDMSILHSHSKHFTAS